MAGRKVLEVSVGSGVEVKEGKKDKEKEEKLTQEEREQKLIEETPDGIREDIEDIFETGKGKWITCVDRRGPAETEDGIPLHIGQLVRHEGPVRPSRIEEITEKSFGGGEYAARYMCAGRIKKLHPFDIPGEPKPTTKEKKRAGSPTPEQIEDKAKEYEKKKERIEAELEYKKAAKHAEKEIKKLDEEDNEDDSDDYGMGMPFMGDPRMLRDPRFAMMFGQKPQEDPVEVERRVRAEMELKTENSMLKEKLNALDVRMNAMLDAKNEQPPQKEGLGADGLIKVLGAVLPIAKVLVSELKPKDKPERDPVEDFTKMAAAMGMGKEKKDDTLEIMKSGMAILTTQMQSSIETSSQMNRMAMETSFDMMRKSIMDGAGVSEPEDWKVSLGKKFLDAGQAFSRELFGFNKEKLALDHKKLDAVLRGQRGRVALPGSTTPQPPIMPPRQTPPQVPVQAAQAPITPLVAPQQETEEQMQIRMVQQGQNLFTAAFGAFSQGANPQDFADATMELGGEEITEWLLGCNDVAELKELVDAYGAGDEFKKYIDSIPGVKAWLNNWLIAMKNTYHMEGEPIEPQIPLKNEETQGQNRQTVAPTGSETGSTPDSSLKEPLVDALKPEKPKPEAPKTEEKTSKRQTKESAKEFTGDMPAQKK